VTFSTLSRMLHDNSKDDPNETGMPLGHRHRSLLARGWLARWSIRTKTAMSREIRSFDYVNHPYARVRDALSADAVGVFGAATKAAASRAESVAAELRVNLGGLEMGTDIAVSVGEIEETGTEPGFTPVTRISVEWEAAQRPHLFPLMSAELSIYPLTPTETQIDFMGWYEPPGGVLGDAVDAVVGHKIAEASVHRLIADVALYLRKNLSP
jgi:hypothetical protein